MENFTPWTALIGGAMIGVASWMMLALNGKIAGISGILAGLLPPKENDWAWRGLFLAGLVGGVALWRLIQPGATISFEGAGWPLLVVGGLLVGAGTRLGGGCTSGHGVCGIGRLSVRSLAATVIFMVVAVLTVFIVRHVVGG
jgi:uncharacterized membrane protein YedE/YeeE